MRLREIIMPQDNIFFDLLMEQSKTLRKGGEALLDLIEDYRDLAVKAAKIKDLEHQGDALAHDLYKRLNMTFITPIDQEDLISLTSKLDDVLDAINGVARRISIFDIDQPTENMRGFADLVSKATEEIRILVTNIKKADQKQVEQKCEKIDSLENDGDELLHASLLALFKEEDPVKIIKYKEIYEWLESVLDRCEDVGYVIADIVMKYR